MPDSFVRPGRRSHGGGFDVALDYFEEGISSGRLTNGDKLPSERDLAAQLGVSRGAVREAIRMLQALGILVSETGRGNGTRVESSPSNAIGRILRLQLALSLVSFSDLTETRVALERATSAAAARQRRPEPLVRAQKVLDRMSDASDQDTFNELDTDFHIALAEAGGNGLMSDLTVAIREAVHSPIKSAELAVADWTGTRRQLVDDHVAMLQAVKAGDAEQAARLTEKHIRSAYATLLHE